MDMETKALRTFQFKEWLLKLDKEGWWWEHLKVLQSNSLGIEAKQIKIIHMAPTSVNAVFLSFPAIVIRNS